MIKLKSVYLSKDNQSESYHHGYPFDTSSNNALLLYCLDILDSEYLSIDFDLTPQRLKSD